MRKNKTAKPAENGEYHAVITDIKQDRIVSTSEPFIDVEIAIKRGDEVVEVRKLGYPQDTTEADIKADIKNIVALYAKEVVANAKAKEVEAIDAETEATIGNLKDTEIR